MSRTVDSVLDKMRGNTEIIVVMDGNWADPGLEDNPNVTIIHHAEAIGQRQATNEAARYSQAKYVMKLDAHCDVDEGFDVKLLADIEPDWTVVPRMHNLHAFDWVCKDCGTRKYQGPKECNHCQSTNLEMDIIWKRKKNSSDYMWFDPNLKFAYFDSNYMRKWMPDENASKSKKAYSHKHKDWAKGQITDQMTCLGACWLMSRERYWELGGMDEGHGSWGQMGTEIACKSWLSGGRQVVNKNTWFAHMFRTQGKDFSFPYPLSGKQTDYALKYSQDMWFNNKWHGQKHPLSWMIEKFGPLPGWEEWLEKENASSQVIDVSECVIPKPLADELRTDTNNITIDIEAVDAVKFVEVLEEKGHLIAEVIENKRKGMVYYTDNLPSERVLNPVRRQLSKIRNGHALVSVSQIPIDFGENVVVDLERCQLTMFKQILIGLEAIKADIVFLCEHDVLYHPSHFDFTPEKKDIFYYNQNVWKVDAKSGQALFYYTKQTSGLVAYRDLLIE
ncbi:MAG TPA: glycosyltransferase, partial [Patescibacteria group bacterium]|nr:glycosyltransferase [Patescibacteria group bacterium]